MMVAVAVAVWVWSADGDADARYARQDGAERGGGVVGESAGAGGTTKENVACGRFVSGAHREQEESMLTSSEGIVSVTWNDTAIKHLD